jgi:hypothetical protein
MRRAPALFLRACALAAALSALAGTALLASAGCSLIDATSDCSSACNTLKTCGVLPVSDCGLYCATAVSGATAGGCLDQLNAQDSCAKANTTCSTAADASCVSEVSAFTQCMANYCATNPDGQGCPGGDGGTPEAGVGDGG